MINQVVCVGRLCKDLELKYTPQGMAVCENVLAFNRKMKDKPDKAIFVKIVAYGRGAEVLNQYCKKGDRIAVVGELDFNQWQDKQGKTQSQNYISVEKIELLESKGSNQQQSSAQATPPPAQNIQNQTQTTQSVSDDDFIPF